MEQRLINLQGVLHSPIDRPAVMGIINCTPDSFYAGSRRGALRDAAAAAAEMEEAGADILDIGGESTRPGSRYIGPEEELERVVPVIREIRKSISIPISVDTRKHAVARAALEAGAEMINDISALEEDPDLAHLIAETEVPVILMHKKGVPENMQDRPFYIDVVGEVKAYLRDRIDFAVSEGIDRSRIVIDPGIGFGKRVRDNLEILRHLADFSELGVPVCLGASRKSFIGTVTRGPGRDGGPEERLAGTLAVHAWAIQEGVRIIRVHDVRENADLVAMLMAISRAGEG